MQQVWGREIQMHPQQKLDAAGGWSGGWVQKGVRGGNSISPQEPVWRAAMLIAAALFAALASLIIAGYF